MAGDAAEDDAAMKRTLIGLVFVLHGLAHSGVGMWAVPLGPDWFVVPVWWLAEVGFIVAGFGLLGIPWCRKIWEPVAVVAEPGTGDEGRGRDHVDAGGQDANELVDRWPHRVVDDGIRR